MFSSRAEAVRRDGVQKVERERREDPLQPLRHHRGVHRPQGHQRGQQR